MWVCVLFSLAVGECHSNGKTHSSENWKYRSRHVRGYLYISESSVSALKYVLCSFGHFYLRALAYSHNSNLIVQPLSSHNHYFDSWFDPILRQSLANRVALSIIHPRWYPVYVSLLMLIYMFVFASLLSSTLFIQMELGSAQGFSLLKESFFSCLIASLMHLLTAGNVGTEDRGQLRRKWAATRLKIAVIIFECGERSTTSRGTRAHVSHCERSKPQVVKATHTLYKLTNCWVQASSSSQSCEHVIHVLSLQRKPPYLTQWDCLSSKNWFDSSHKTDEATFLSKPNYFNRFPAIIIQ